MVGFFEKFKNKIFNRMNKNGIVVDTLVWWLLAAVVLIVVVFIIMILLGKGENMIEYIKDILRLG